MGTSGCRTTRAPCAAATAAVWSSDSRSTTMISSQNAIEARQGPSRWPSFLLDTIAETATLARVTAILGLNAYHGDAAAALVIDGELVAAAEEERFNRVKHVAGFPSLSAAWCLADAGIVPADLDHVAVSRHPTPNFGSKLRLTPLPS